MPSVLFCTIALWLDGDTLACRTGQRVRIAGVEANERRGGCHLPRCPALPHKRALAAATRIAPPGTVVRFRVVGTSYERVVGDAPWLRCQLNASGATVPWERYVREYRLRPCGGGR